MPIQITTHLTKEKQDEQHQLSYHQLIDYFFQHADIEIKITNIDRDVFDYFKEIQYNLKNLNLNIQYTQIDQSLKFLESRIYQVNEQQDNNVSQLDKMTILHRLVIERFYNEAAKQKITIKIRCDKFQYKIVPQTQMEESGTKFYKYFKQILDSYIILIAYLNSEFEANSKIKLLKKPRIRESFCKEIDLSQLNIILASEINLTVLDEYLQLKNHGMALKKQANQIIVIGNSYDQNMNIKELQKKFEDFLHNPQYMKNVKETFDIDFLMPKDIDEIDKSLRKLKEQEEFFEIIVTNPVTNVQNKGKYLVQAELYCQVNIPLVQYMMITLQLSKGNILIGSTVRYILNDTFKISINLYQKQNCIKCNLIIRKKFLNQQQLWIEGDQPEYIIMQRLQAVKGKLNEIYHPNIIIKITEQEKIKLWNQFLGQLFENQNNSKECITKQNNLELSIELNGKQDAIFEKQQKIQQYLEQFKCIILNCQCDIDVAIVLQSKEYQFSSLFSEILAEIASEFGQCLIKMIEVNKKKQLVVEVYYNQVLFQQNIISQKINTFFENLGNYLVKIDFKEFLNYVDMKEIQFQNIFQVVVLSVKLYYIVSKLNKESTTSIIGKEESLEEIRNLLLYSFYRNLF